MFRVEHSTLFGLFDPEDEHTLILWNNSNYLYLTNGTVSQSWRLESSVTSVREPQIHRRLLHHKEQLVHTVWGSNCHALWESCRTHKCYIWVKCRIFVLLMVMVNYNNHGDECVWLTSAVRNVLTAVYYVGMFIVIFAHFGVLPFRDGKVNMYHHAVHMCTCVCVCMCTHNHFKFQTCWPIFWNVVIHYATLRPCQYLLISYHQL
jgi:hypothetical protein